jgi:ABC-2 type transport system permease protein
MATAITIPMMFLGGVFFPIDTLPKWLFSVVQYLPIAPLLRIIRGVVLEGNSPFFNPINIIIVLLWIIACLSIATWKFRLSEE